LQITVNGESVQVSDGATVSELLVARKVKLPEMVSVEINESILDRTAFATTRLAGGDRVELLYFMGGGRGSL
jgi:sulfur carrier protein